MANPSIYAAFERMWQHITAKLGTKADKDHTHDDFVSDWNQNNPEGVGYIQNRTHWADTEQAYVTIVDNQHSDDNFGVNYSIVISGVNSPIVEGNKYLVTFDGTDYPCVAYYADGYISLGDSRLLGGDTDVNPMEAPFCLQYGEGWTEVIGNTMLQADFLKVWDTSGEANSHTVTVKELTETLTYHKLDLNYIPDEVALKSEIGSGNITVDSALSATSTNPVQNKVINEAINNLNTLRSEATTTAAGLMSSSDKTKLDGVAAGAEVNQNAFGKVKIGSTTITADAKTDTLTLAAGDNVTLTPDATNDKITISATNTDTTYSAGTGISLSGTTFSNSGVRSISTGSSNGTISVNTNGTSANVAVKGLGSAAYTASTAYDAAGSANTALTSAKAYTDEVASGKADSSHNHAASNITSGTLSTSRLPTVPVSKGGTGHDFSDIPACSILRNSSDNTGIWYTPTKNGAFYATADNVLPKFGTLPIAQGGTGATDAATARTNLGITPANIGALSTSGGTISGDLYLGNETSTSQYDLYIRRTMDEVLKSGRLYWGTGGVLKLQAASAGTVFNYIELKPDGTAFKQPVTIASGGTGSSNGATGLKNLLAAGSTVLSSHQYGTSLPTAGTAGRIFFKKVSS